MDFGLSLRQEPSTATLANIHHINDNDDDNSTNTSNSNSNSNSNSESESESIKRVSSSVISSANTAASDLLGINPFTKTSYPSTAFPRYTYDRTKCIQPGQLVVIFESFDQFTFVYAKPGAVHHNKNGDFYHDDIFENKLRFGSKLRARNHGGYGYVYLLRPTSELWARSLPHRTQIVYELDSATVIFQLNIKPNMIVLESGTGSGAMSTAIVRTIAPHGRLHTYEFNGVRAMKAREEFQRNKIGHLVTVHHLDVCGKASAGKCVLTSATAVLDHSSSTSTTPDGDNNDNNSVAMEELCEGKGGFAVGGQVAGAIFLDLPEPWLAVPHAAFAIKPNHRLCSYSPCIEQAQKCIVALKDNGFHTIKTIEVRLREHYVDEVELEMPPTAKVVRVEKDDMRLMKEHEAAEFYRKQKLGISGVETSNETKIPNNADADANTKPQKRTKICARPFSVMKGHTAFLTFATAGLVKRADPNGREKTMLVKK